MKETHEITQAQVESPRIEAMTVEERAAVLRIGELLLRGAQRARAAAVEHAGAGIALGDRADQGAA